ncbi:two-component regulator propeller domain-containing protein [Dysgonomonas sp. 25]|uniref:two-component regulator propeller domain-containing protein n=1 Tax=Dysgonomonas sp. 25 TaxID=2302933 RepID=UPI0013D47CDB|nr:two-component regulator propeller domain-containing protein [Dysgonomonas sp. 25]NDV69367.1 helix-turn-helix domain-containing protein [Dysgonomonas sp. 25]
MRTSKCVLLSVLLLLCASLSEIHAYNLRQISSKDGLSNSAILSLYQDKDGYMWFGSCDGLNVFDGLNIKVYKPTNNKNYLSGNLIERIIETKEGIFWVHTNHGLNRLDKRYNHVEYFNQYSGTYFLCKTKENDIFIIREDGALHYYRDDDGLDFLKIDLPGVVFDNVLNIVADSNDYLWVFSNDGTSSCYKIVRDKSGAISLTFDHKFGHPKNLRYCSVDGEMVYFVDEDYTLYEYDLNSNKKYYIDDLSKVIKEKGDISSIVKFNNDYFIGFQTNGLVCLRNTPEKKESYELEEINVRSGIFTLYKDRFQEILWIGTDGDGVYMYSEDAYSIQSVQYRDFTYKVNKPVRAIYVDKENSMWLGTKGDGIIRIRNYEFRQPIQESRIDYYTTTNSQLTDNSVYAFTPGRLNIMWIGNEEGLNYYSYAEGRIKKLDVLIDGEPLRYVHSIYEENTNLLWMATVGMGIISAEIAGTPGNPVLKNIKRYTYDNGYFSSNFFFTIYSDPDGNIWFGNRGYGAFRYDHRIDDVKQLRFGNDPANQTLNDIFCLTKDPVGNLWAGTSFGLIKYAPNQTETIYNEQNGFPNSTIHGMLEGSDRTLWLSTNQGIIKFNMSTGTFQNYGHRNGLNITEFSDGAFYKDERTGALYFGGINGFVNIVEEKYKQTTYIPPVHFNNLSIFGSDANIHNFLSQEKDESVLKLNYNQNFFSLTFTAIDYINGNNYTYYYKLEELSDKWIDIGSDNTASFTNLFPGTYTLQIKYRNRITGEDSPAYSLIVKISPPWYMSTIAYIIYALIILGIAFGCLRFIMARNNKKKEAMLNIIYQQHQEEVYESKLRFFTNIAHEFCTPLTLIYGPCNRILEHKGSDSFVLKYTNLIQRNAERLNALIQELIEFRRIETGNRNPLIEELSITELAYNEIERFNELAESRDIFFEKNIQPHIIWNSDKGFLMTIITNLLSNAFKYTSDHGNVKIRSFIEDDALCIIVSNTGKGIKQENLGRVFDRYSILDNFENQDEKNVSRNGLGLAILYSMVKLLDGTIDVKSELGGWTDFILRLPFVQVDNVEPENNKPLSTLDARNNKTEAIVELPKYEFDKFKQTIVVLDDDIEMLWFISEIFAGKYNVIALNKPLDLESVLDEIQPNIIICDVQMNGKDGILLVKEIKSNPKQAHIPFILVSANHNVDEQIRGLAAGAEMYITKPFNIDYLQVSVERLISRKEMLKDYFSSPLSAYELTDAKLTHKEHKKFVKDIYDVIYKNLINKDLSAKFIADEMNMSTRHLYRKLNDINEQSPADIIKECRLHVAKDLLMNSKLTIDEIIYKSGFSVRSTFFKVFAEKYGCTPKEFREKNIQHIDTKQD